VDAVILLLANTRSNRVFVRARAAQLEADFPVPGAVALKAVARGRWPGGNALILI
jgi:hypothetical protein